MSLRSATTRTTTGTWAASARCRNTVGKVFSCNTFKDAHPIQVPIYCFGTKMTILCSKTFFGYSRKKHDFSTRQNSKTMIQFLIKSRLFHAILAHEHALNRSTPRARHGFIVVYIFVTWGSRYWLLGLIPICNATRDACAKTSPGNDWNNRPTN